MKTNYVMIDMENVKPDNLNLLDRDLFKVFLFVGKNQTKLPIAIVKAVQQFGPRAQYVEISGTGHNALDFHIAFYIGRIAATDKDAFFHIISNDTGFDPLIDHLKRERVFADRVAKIDEIPALIQLKMASKPLSERMSFVKERMLKSNAPRPRTRKTLSSHIAAMLLKALSDEDISNIIDGLFKDGWIRENGKRIVYSDESR